MDYINCINHLNDMRNKRVGLLKLNPSINIYKIEIKALDFARDIVKEKMEMMRGKDK